MGVACAQVWVSAATFFPGSAAPNLLVVGTAYKKIRLYDTRAPDRRPQGSFDLADGYRVTALARASNPVPVDAPRRLLVIGDLADEEVAGKVYSLLDAE
jgi:hypothetical protein